MKRRFYTAVMVGIVSLFLVSCSNSQNVSETAESSPTGIDVTCIPALHNYAFAGSGITPKSLYNCSCFFRTSPTISAVPGAS